MALFEVNGLKTYYYTSEGIVRAIDDAGISLGKGKALGLAGESGCGKTTMALSIMRLIPPPGRVVEGEVKLDGENILDLEEKEFKKRISWKRISLVFQGAMNSLNPLMKIGDQITEAIQLHMDLTKTESLEKAKDLLEMVQIESSRIENYPFEFSGGMKQRVLIAMALACNPDIVILDEPTTALDVIVASRIMSTIKDLQERLDLSMILITHNLSVLAQTCENLSVMYAGKIVESSDIVSAFRNPLHPYTNALITAFPSIRGEAVRREGLIGSPPNMINPPFGCRFHPRCPYADEICQKVEPELIELESDHLAACHFSGELNFLDGRS